MIKFEPMRNLPDFSIFERLDELVIKATCVPRRNRIVRLGTKQDFLDLFAKIVKETRKNNNG